MDLVILYRKGSVLLFSFLQGDFLLILARIAGLLVAIPLHEVSHAFVSDKLGDHTARDLGRLTLNPIKHFDVMGFVCMMIIGVGWAKPVPINPAFYKNPRRGMAITAVAGPLSNFLLAYVGMVFYKTLSYSAEITSASTAAALIGIATFFFYFCILNLNLTMFNLLPIPPLDGSRVFGLLLPKSMYFKVMGYGRFLMFGVLILVYLGLLQGPLSFLNNLGIQILSYGTFYIDLLFRILVF